ncbi:DUF4895 domain-containing protein [Pseudothermotoga sp.]|nr:DUF4895 domain-containing protein [Pseudothermotoga sp.]MDW8138881.1 DUF4895 domain-containing protein [Pseudothermotoga sp.]
MNFGPKSITNKLSKALEKIEVSKLLSQMENLKEKLDQYHKHVVLASVGEVHGFYLFGAVDHLGRKLAGLSISNPFERNLPIYVLQQQVSFAEIYEELFGIQPQFHRCGIVKLPLNFKAICVVGDEDFLGKEIFKEKVYGEKKLSFAEIIDELIYNKLKALNSSTIGLIKIRLLDEGILCLVEVPKDIDRSHVPLLAEIAHILKGRYTFTCRTKYQSIVSAAPVLTSLCIDYEHFLRGFDVGAFCQEFSNKLMKAYECVLRAI